MKFPTIALSAMLGLASAKKSFSGAELKKRMNAGKFDKKALLRNSKPYGNTKDKLRKLDQQEEFEINGYYSVQFDTCLNLRVEDEDLLDDEMINYAANGQAIATKSYIIFSICQTEYCYYDEDDSKLQFLTDIGSFFNAFVEYLPGQVESYCQGCEQNQDYCQGNMDGEQGAEDGEQDGAEEGQEEGEQEGEEGEGEEGEEGEGEEGEGEEGEGDERKLKKSGRRKLANNRVVEYIDCDLCETYECFEAEEEQDGEQDGEQYEFEDALEWLYGLSECQQSESQWNDMEVYGGLICSDGGDGVEVGVFLDEECLIFAPSLSYQNFMAYEEKSYHSMSQEVVEYMFTNDFDCYNQEVEYINPYDEVEEDAEEEDDNGEAPEASEWCQNLFDGEFEALSLYDCGYNGDEEQEEQEEQEQDENAQNYEWYWYEVTQDQVEDAQEVCKIVQTLDGAYETVYDSESSGSLYDYSKQKNGGFNSNGEGLSAGVITVIILVVVAVAAGVGLFLKGKKSDESKKAPLINNGSMA